MSTIGETLARAKLHHNTGELIHAVQLYEQVLQADATHLEALFLLGAACHGLGRANEAIAHLTRLLQLKPDHSEANNYLGVVLAQNGRMDEAATFCRRSVELKPGVAEAHKNLAAILANQGKLEEAVACSRRALELAAAASDGASAYPFLLQFLDLGGRAFPPDLKLLMARAATKDWRLLDQMDWVWRGYVQNQAWPSPGVVDRPRESTGPLRAYFDAHREGRGIWKWLHYFDIYDRHFSRFRGQEVHILEIGIYSGGSLPMWKEYFGPKARIYGVDIEESCKAYEDDSARVFIGDQEDRGFWRRFKEGVPTLDIVIDDGGHAPNQQIVTLEELLPHLRPGGVYLCEDVHGPFNRFASYMTGIHQELNACKEMAADPNNPERRLTCKATGFQAAIHSIHHYPFVTVIEKRETPLAELVAPKRGTQWEPFLA